MAETPADVVAELKASIPTNPHGLRPWWERVDQEHHELLAAIHEAWRAGELGAKQITAARRISQKLRTYGITIGEQGVIAWLKRPTAL